MNEDFLLALKPDFKIKDYKECLDSENIDNKQKIIEFIIRRFYQRYIQPWEFTTKKSGFGIMANCCLLIESYETFYRGWAKSPSTFKTFKYFFERSKFFTEFRKNNMDYNFYKHIRCGILHQGETTGGWKLRRDKSSKLDIIAKSINAEYFIIDLKKEIEIYFKSLIEKEWECKEWQNLFKKMNFIIQNCE